jgi:hypothetical protein
MHTPKENSFSLPPKRYFQRHHLPPEGLISRYNPRLSNNLKILLFGFTERIFMSVSGMWGATHFSGLPIAPKVAPNVGQL